MNQPHRQPIDLTCDDTLRDNIRRRLSEFDRIPIEDRAATQAAVALTVVNASSTSDSMSQDYGPHDPTDAALILTLRSFGLKAHSGQWALPGGRIEKGESPIEAALRELQEEVGLSRTANDVIGLLDDFKTRSGYIMTPVVIWGGTNANLVPDPVEVGSIHRIPLREFLRPDAPLLSHSSVSENPILMMPIGHSAIAAPTGAILYQFREVAIKGDNTRVAHYEQPSFAWS